jgi:hypothetical protein
VDAAISDTTGFVGIAQTTQSAGNSVDVVLRGQSSCVFDGATTAGDYIQESTTTAGDCHDAGSTRPTSGQIIGRVLSTNGSAGNYLVEVFGLEQVGVLSNGSTGSGSVVLATSPTISSPTITTPTISGAVGGNIDLGAANATVFEIGNAAGGTSANMLAKLTGAPSTAVTPLTTDTRGIVGIVVGGAGTSGTAQIAFDGVASCIFDNGTTAGDYVSISSTTAGDCHDAGTAIPTSGQILGLVLSTNVLSSTPRAMRLFSGVHMAALSVPTSATVSTAQSTNTTASYQDLTTAGPSVTVTVSSTGQALVTLTTTEQSSQGNNQCWAGFIISGASGVNPSDAQAVILLNSAASTDQQGSATFLVTGLTAGSNTFKMQYKPVSGKTCTFANRTIFVTPY